MVAKICFCCNIVPVISSLAYFDCQADCEQYKICLFSGHFYHVVGSDFSLSSRTHHPMAKPSLPADPVGLIQLFSLKEVEAKNQWFSSKSLGLMYVYIPIKKKNDPLKNSLTNVRDIPFFFEDMTHLNQPDNLPEVIR